MGVHSYALPNKGNDYVYLKDLQLSAVVGQDAWGRTGKEQPVFLSVKWFHDLGGTDRLEETLSYSKMAKDIIESIKSRNGGFNSVQSLAEFIVYVAIDKDWKGAALLVEAHLPKALLEAANGLKFSRGHYLQELNSERQPFDARELYPRVTLEDIRLLCIIGVNPHERETKQAVRVDMSIEEDLSMGAADGIATHWRGLVHHVVQVSWLQLIGWRA